MLPSPASTPSPSTPSEIVHPSVPLTSTLWAAAGATDTNTNSTPSPAARLDITHSSRAHGRAPNTAWTQQDGCQALCILDELQLSELKWLLERGETRNSHLRTSEMSMTFRLPHEWPWLFGARLLCFCCGALISCAQQTRAR